MTYKTGRELVDDARSRVSEVTAAEAVAERNTGGDIVFLDVREQNEVNLGRIAGAVHISRGNLETRVEGLIPREKRVIIYCANGNRSALAALTLSEMGYGNVASISDGWSGWVGADGAVDD